MTVLLTGGTGLVGRYLLRELLLQGHPVAVVVRSQGDQTAPERLGRIVAHWEREIGKPLPRPVCLEGDVSQAGLGLSREARAWVAHHCGSVLHNAASLTFFGADRSGEPWLTNYTGTGNVLDLCRDTGLRELHYVSTAYVCGKRQGAIREDELDCGQEYRNDYERCKFEAEKRVRDAGHIHRLTVYRPAVIAGDAQTGYTSTYHGIYSYLQFLWLIAQLLPREEDGRVHLPVRVNLTGAELRNIVPVDWVAAVIGHIFRRPRLHGATYHLTPLKPVVVREFVDTASSYFNLYGPTFVGPGNLEAQDWNESEKMFYDYVARYEQYWTTEPTFDCRNTLWAVPHLPCPPLDEACLRRLLDFAVHDRFGKRREMGNAAGVARHRDTENEEKRQKVR